MLGRCLSLNHSAFKNLLLLDSPNKNKPMVGNAQLDNLSSAASSAQRSLLGCKNPACNRQDLDFLHVLSRSGIKPSPLLLVPLGASKIYVIHLGLFQWCLLVWCINIHVWDAHAPQTYETDK